MKRNLTTLQAGRGVAAIAVLLYHVGAMAKDNLGHDFGFGLFARGNHGVDFFFILSGFIIFYANHESTAMPSEAPRYFFRRLARVYPLVILLTLAKVAYMLIGGPGVLAGKRDLTNILCSFLLIPQMRMPVVAVSWTLWYEMFFYCIFLMVILYGRCLYLFMAAHAAACVVVNIPGVPDLYAPANFFFNPYAVDFYMGCIAARLWLKGNLSPDMARGACFAGLTLILVGGGFHRELEGLLGSLFILYWGASFFLIVLGISVLEQHGLLKAPRWLTFPGDASYSIYLIHTSVLEVAYRVLAKHGAFMRGSLGPITLAALAVLTVFVGLCCYVLIEKPILLWLHRKGPPKNRIQPPVTFEPASTSLSA